MTKKKAPSGPRLTRRWLSALLVTVPTFLAATISPTAASHPSTLNNGVGIQTHIGVPFQPMPPCAHYYTYDADVAFTLPNGGGVVNATISSPVAALQAPWDEGPDGTHPRGSNCAPGGNGARIDGFTVVLSGAVNCVSANAGYSRNRENIEIANLDNGACHGISTLKYQIFSVEVNEDATDPPTTVGFSACNSPIAPQTCVIAPARTLNEPVPPLV